MIVNAKDSKVYIQDNHLHKIRFSTSANHKHWTRNNMLPRANRLQINRRWRNSLSRQAGMGTQAGIGTIDIQGQRFIGEIMDKLVALERENARLLRESLVEQSEKHENNAIRERAEQQKWKDRDLELLKKDISEKSKTFSEAQKSKDTMIRMLLGMVMFMTLMNVLLALKIWATSYNVLRRMQRAMQSSAFLT